MNALGMFILGHTRLDYRNEITGDVHTRVPTATLKSRKPGKSLEYLNK